jgi:hypothetical protein
LIRDSPSIPKVHGQDGLGDLDPAFYGVIDTSPLVSASAVDLILEIVDKSPDQIDLVATGPLTNVAQAIRSLDQSYSYRGFRGCSSMTAGSAIVDQSVDVMGDRRANSPGGNQHQSSVQAPNTSLDSSEPDPESVDEQEPREREGIQDED